MIKKGAMQVSKFCNNNKDRSKILTLVHLKKQKMSVKKALRRDPFICDARKYSTVSNQPIVLVLFFLNGELTPRKF